MAGGASFAVVLDRLRAWLASGWGRWPSDRGSGRIFNDPALYDALVCDAAGRRTPFRDWLSERMQGTLLVR